MKPSSLTKLIIGCVVVGGLVLGCVSVGHPNLAAAQKFSEQAYQKITAAQEANEWDMQGHAAKAKSLLEQADNELKAAAQAANKAK